MIKLLMFVLHTCIWRSYFFTLDHGLE